MSKVSSVTFQYVIKALEQQSGICSDEMLDYASINKQLFHTQSQSVVKN